MSPTLRLALLATVVFATRVPSARAQTPPPSPVASTRLGLEVVGAILPGRELRSGPNPAGLGLGLEVGHTFPVGFYLGTNLAFFPRHDAMDTLTSFTWVIDLGYDLRIGRVSVLRPSLGLGTTRYLRSNDSADATYAPLLVPSVDLILDVSDHIYVGGSLGVALTLIGSSSASSGSSDLSVHLGARFGVDGRRRCRCECPAP